MGGQELERDQKEPTDGGKRKLQLADQKPQEIAAEANSPRIDIIISVNKPLPFPVPSTAQSNQNPVENKKFTIPKIRIGLVVGKGGKTIKQIRLQSGADVQIAKDHEADLHSFTRDVDVTDTEERISRAEELVNAVIFQEATAVSPTVHGVNVNQSEGKQFTVEVKVPNDKVGLLIGTGRETIKYMQRKSGANMKVFPRHLHPGDLSTERTLYINGTATQIKAAKKLVKDVIHGKRISDPPVSSGYAQLAYASAGNRAQVQQLAQYGYAHSGHQPTDVSYYGQTWHETGQMVDYGYYGYIQKAPDDTENISDQTEQQRPYGQLGGQVSSHSAEAVSAYPPFWCSLGADPPASWQTESGYDPTVHWWDQTLMQQVNKPGHKNHRRKGQSRSRRTRTKTRDENP